MKSQIEILEKWQKEKDNRSAIVILTDEKESLNLILGEPYRLSASITALMLQEKDFTNLILKATKYAKKITEIYSKDEQNN